MADLILRFSLYTSNDKIDIKEISKKISSDNIEVIYSKGERYGQHVRKENAIDYKYIFKEITSIDNICNFFIKEWKPYSEILIGLGNYKFKSYLLFEFDIADLRFPELIFDTSFLSFLSEMDIELQMFFYT